MPTVAFIIFWARYGSLYFSNLFTTKPLRWMAAGGGGGGVRAGRSMDHESFTLHKFRCSSIFKKKNLSVMFTTLAQCFVGSFR